MSAALLAACRAAGIMLQVDGDDLVVEVNGDPPAELIAELRKHKAEVIAFLTSRRDEEPNAADLEERAAIIEYGAGVPRAWAEGFAALCSMPPPPGFSLARWQRIVDATGVFIDRWAPQAARLGWSDLDVFGVDPDRPGARFDCMGLVLMLDRCMIVDVDADGATLETGTSALRYRRRPPPPGTVSLWELKHADDGPEAA
jgi:hypothetical protein